jgi:hypothetical protein
MFVFSYLSYRLKDKPETVRDLRFYQECFFFTFDQNVTFRAELDGILVDCFMTPPCSEDKWCYVLIL